MRKTSSMKVSEKKNLNKNAGNMHMTSAGLLNVDHHKKKPINCGLRQRCEITKYGNISTLLNTIMEPCSRYTFHHGLKKSSTSFQERNVSKTNCSTQTKHQRLIKAKHQSNTIQNYKQSLKTQGKTLNVKQKMPVKIYIPTMYHNEVKQITNKINIPNDDRYATNKSPNIENSKLSALKDIYRDIRTYRENLQRNNKRVHFESLDSSYHFLNTEIHQLCSQKKDIEKEIRTINGNNSEEKNSNHTSSSSQSCAKTSKLENAVNVFGSLIDPEEVEVLKTVLHVDTLPKANVETITASSNSNDLKLLQFANNLLKKTNEYLSELEFNLDMDNKILSEHSQLLKNLSKIDFSPSANQDEEILHVKKLVDKYFTKFLPQNKINTLSNKIMDASVFNELKPDVHSQEETKFVLVKNIPSLKSKEESIQNSKVIDNSLVQPIKEVKNWNLIHGTAVQPIKEIKSLFKKQNFDLKNKLSSRSLNRVITSSQSSFNDIVKPKNTDNVELIKSAPIVSKDNFVELITEESSAEQNKSLISVKHTDKTESNLKESKIIPKYNSIEPIEEESPTIEPIKRECSAKQNKSLISIKHINKTESHSEESKSKLTIQELPSVNINGVFQIQSIPPINIKPTSFFQKSTNNIAVLEIKHLSNEEEKIENVDSTEKKSIINVSSQMLSNVNTSFEHNEVQKTRTINDVCTNLKQEECNCNLNLLLDIVKSIERKLGSEPKNSDSLDKNTIQNKSHNGDQSIYYKGSLDNLPTSCAEASKKSSSQVNLHDSSSSSYSSFEKSTKDDEGNSNDNNGTSSNIKNDNEVKKEIDNKNVLSENISEKTEDNVSSLLSSVSPSLKYEDTETKNMKHSLKNESEKEILKCVYELNGIVQSFQKLHMSEKIHCNCACEEKIQCIAQKIPVNYDQWENMTASIKLLTEQFEEHKSSQLKLKEDIQNTIDKNMKLYQKENIKDDNVSSIDENKHELQIKTTQYIPYSKLNPGGASEQIKIKESDFIKSTYINEPSNHSLDNVVISESNLNQSNNKKIMSNDQIVTDQIKATPYLVDSCTQSNEIRLISSATQIKLKNECTEKGTQYEKTTSTVSTETEVIAQMVSQDDMKKSEDKKIEDFVSLETLCVKDIPHDANIPEQTFDDKNMNYNQKNKLENENIVLEKVSNEIQKVSNETQTIPNISQEYIDHAGQFILDNLNSVRLYNSSYSTLYSTEAFKRGSKQYIEESSSSSDNDVFTLAQSQSNIQKQNYSSLSHNHISPGEKLSSLQSINKYSKIPPKQVSSSVLSKNLIKPNSLSDGEIILPCDCNCSFGEIHTCQKTHNLKSILKKVPFRLHRNIKLKFQESDLSNKSSSSSTIFSDVISNIESSEELSSDGRLK